MMKYDCAPASREEWIAAAEACPYATYFHTPYWYELFAPKQNHAAVSVRFDDGASAVVLFAEIRRAGGLLVDRFSSPGGNYGGWLGGTALKEERVKILLDILMSKKNLTFRANPFDPSSRFIGINNTGDVNTVRIKDNIKGVNIKDDFTHTLDLTGGLDCLRRGMSRGHRSAMNTAARGGVTVKQAETLEEWGRYYGLYLDSVERWRAGKLKPRTVYPASLFKRVYGNRTGNEILWLAVKGGEPIAGALFFYWGRHAVYWHGAASARHFGLRPNNLLFWEIISDAARRGYEIFDFNPSGGYGGVESFKERFGAKRVPAPVISTKTPLRSLISAIRAKGDGR